MTQPPRPSAALAVLPALALAAAVAVLAVHLAPRPAAAPETDLAPGSAALRAVINPETGKVEVGSFPAPAGIQRLALDPETLESLRRDSEGLVPVTRPDGSVHVDLMGRFQSVSVAHLDGNGVVSICTEHAEGAEAALSGRISRPAPEVK